MKNRHHYNFRHSAVPCMGCIQSLLPRSVAFVPQGRVSSLVAVVLKLTRAPRRALTLAAQSTMDVDDAGSRGPMQRTASPIPSSNEDWDGMWDLVGQRHAWIPRHTDKITGDGHDGVVVMTEHAVLEVSATGTKLVNNVRPP